MALQIKWALNAEKQLQEILAFIENDSPQNALVVLSAIDIKIRKASNYPYAFAADKYKTANNGAYRYFETKGIRVSYKIDEPVLQVLRCRSTKRKPVKY